MPAQLRVSGQARKVQLGPLRRSTGLRAGRAEFGTLGDGGRKQMYLAFYWLGIIDRCEGIRNVIHFW